MEHEVHSKFCGLQEKETFALEIFYLDKVNIYKTFYTFIGEDIYQNMLDELGPGSLLDSHQMLYPRLPNK